MACKKAPINSIETIFPGSAAHLIKDLWKKLIAHLGKSSDSTMSPTSQKQAEGIFKEMVAESWCHPGKCLWVR